MHTEGRIGYGVETTILNLRSLRTKVVLTDVRYILFCQDNRPWYFRRCSDSAGGWITEETEFISLQEPEIVNPQKHSFKLWGQLRRFFLKHSSPGFLSSEIKELGLDPTTHPHLQSLPIHGTSKLRCFEKRKNRSNTFKIHATFILWE